MFVLSGSMVMAIELSARNPSHVGSPCVIVASAFTLGSCVAYPFSGNHVPLKTRSTQFSSRGCWGFESEACFALAV